MNSTVFSKKNIPALCLLAVIVLIPIVLAIVSASRVTDVGISDTASKIIVSAHDGSEQTLAGEEAVRYYSDLIGNAHPISSEYELSEETPFVVTICDNTDAVKEYRFYPSEKNGNCLFVSDDGSYYMVAEEDTAALFARPEFAVANLNAVVPDAVVVMSENLSYTLKATSGTWNYRTGSGEQTSKEITPAGTSDVVRVNAAAGMLTFAAEKQPSSVSAVLMKDGAEVFSGQYENLFSSAIITDNDTYYDLTVTAVWDEDPDGGSSFGTAVYEGRLLYDVPATYTVAWSGKATVSDFATVMITNYDEGNTLQAVCDYPVPQKIYVYDYEPDHCKVAFIPITYSVGKEGTYGLTLKTDDGSAETVPLIIRATKNKPSAAEQNLLVEDEALRGCYTEATMMELREKTDALTAASENKILWDGGWIYPDGSETYQKADGFAEYGTKRTVNGVQITDYYFAADVSMAEGREVKAPNSGKVVFAGTLGMTGNTVIIDHGMSILSVVGHLSEISVTEGAAVAKGSVIGTSGSTGFSVRQSGVTAAAAPSTFYAVLVGGDFVNPIAMKTGVSFGKKS